ncbi:hypothetical protein DUNSADRAFT_1247 [Dunaliella salina]|uniref:Phosphodiesterase n=1 Tax=Dunaliella salina TaxID=3046 RepID=A0ABQ7FXR2_DUNSA|nr:hypothetical protein DUNSADRAFT_1247 [Dunaliella salina]|eukprot:KAF5827146.1 hypothetical protein DUNSADRAFT_1247 [Dunaliella salina]
MPCVCLCANEQGELDSATAKELHEKQIKELCARNNSLEMQAARDKLLAEFTKETLSRTPADKMLTMMAELLDGMVPSIQDILFVQSVVLESLDIYQPVNLGKQLLHGTDLEEEVGMALLHQLGGNVTAVLSSASHWQFDAFKLNDVSNGHPLSSLAFYLFHTEGLIEHFSLKPAHLASCAGSESSLPASTKSAFSAPPTAGCTAPSPFAASPISTNLVGPGANNTSLATSHSSSISATGLANPSNPCPALSAVQRRCMRCPPSPSVTFNSLSLASTAHQSAPPQVALPHALAVPEERSRYANGQSHTRLSLQMEPESLRQCQLQKQQQQQEADEALQERQDISRQSSGQMTAFTAEEVDHFPSPSSGPIFGEVIHDYEHMGCTNDFLINKCDDLAVRYNDRAPLENHHLAAAFLLLKQPSYNFLSSMPKPSFDRLRKLVIELVLATDMKQHFAIVSHFTTIHRLSSSASLTPSLPSLKENTRGRRSESGYSSAGHRSLNSGDPGAPGQHIILPLDESERLLSLQVALKCCDLGGAKAPPAKNCKTSCPHQ